jgi:trigger factor
MALKIEKEILENRQVKLIVTIDPEKVEKEKKEAARRISQQVNIPGFRKGKAPYHIVERMVGDEAIFEEALDGMLQEVYKEALEETQLEPYAPGTLDNVSRDPLVLTFSVPLPPQIDLGAYRDVRIPFEIEEVPEKQVDEVLESLRAQHAVLDPVERPIQMGDAAMLDIMGTVVDGEGQAEEGQERPPLIKEVAIKVLVNEEATFPVPGFPEKVVGMAAGEQRSFDLTVPDDKELGEEVRGKTIHFEVTCHKVYQYNAPALDDEFAKEAGDYADLADLRAKIRSRLERAAEEEARERYLDRLLDHLIEENIVKVEYPPIMLEEEIDSMIKELDNRLQEAKLSLEAYLRAKNLSMEALRDELRETAKERLVRGLVLAEVAAAERLTVSEEEVGDEIETMALSFGTDAPLARRFFSSPQSRRSIAARLVSQRVLDRLILIGRGEAPDLSVPSAEEADASADNQIEEPTSATEEQMVEKSQTDQPEEA